MSESGGLANFLNARDTKEENAIMQKVYIHLLIELKALPTSMLSQ